MVLLCIVASNTVRRDRRTVRRSALYSLLIKAGRTHTPPLTTGANGPKGGKAHRLPSSRPVEADRNGGRLWTLTGRLSAFNVQQRSGLSPFQKIDLDSYNAARHRRRNADGVYVYDPSSADGPAGR